MFKKAFDEDHIKEIDEKANEDKIKDFYNINEKNIFFMTHQKLVNTLDKSLLKLSDFTIVIFDECHHSYDNHPYNTIMKHYFKEKLSFQSKLPLIIGLSASLGTNKGSALSHIFTLCANMDCKSLTYVDNKADELDLDKNIPSTFDDEILLASDSMTLISILNKTKQVSNEIIKLTDVDVKAEHMGEPRFENDLVMARKSGEINSNRSIIIADKYLWELNLFFMRVKDFSIKYCLKKLNLFWEASSVDKPEQVEQDCRLQLNSLIQFIENNLNGFEENRKLKLMIDTILKCHKQNSRGLVLVRTRQHTQALSEFVNENPVLKRNGIESVVLYGQGTVDDLTMNGNEQKRAIDKFRNGKCKLMVATDIAQEGLDIPECNYVIRYEFVSNEIGTVQSRGRARAEKGQLFLITTRSNYDLFLLLILENDYYCKK